MNGYRAKEIRRIATRIVSLQNPDTTSVMKEYDPIRTFDKHTIEGPSVVYPITLSKTCIRSFYQKLKRSYLGRNKLIGTITM